MTVETFRNAGEFLYHLQNELQPGEVSLRYDGGNFVFGWIFEHNGRSFGASCAVSGDEMALIRILDGSAKNIAERWKHQMDVNHGGTSVKVAGI